jgi:hypothetical protein
MSTTSEHPTRARIRRDAIRRMRTLSSPGGDPHDLSNLDLELQTKVLLSTTDEAYLIEVPEALAITAIDNVMTKRDWNTAAGVGYEPPFASTLLVFDQPVFEDYILDDIIHAAHLYREVNMYVNANAPEEDDIMEECNIIVFGKNDIYEMKWFSDGSYDPDMWPEYIPEKCEFLRRLAVTLTETLRSPDVTIKPSSTRGLQGQVDYVAMYEDA